MGFVSPPLPEPWEVYKDRWDELEKEGKPITLENLDPKYWKWYKGRQRFQKFQLITLSIGGGLLLLCIILTIIISFLKNY
jgi:hypothetical protein